MSLKDHKQFKKKLIPKFLDFVGGNFPGISWQGQKVPEIIWLCFINDKKGRKRSVEMSLPFFKVVLESINDKSLSPFLISSYENLSDQEVSKIIEGLKTENLYDSFYDGLADFNCLFPENPLVKIFLQLSECEPNVNLLKELISKLSDPNSIETVHTFGTIIFSEIYNGRLKVPAQSHLSNFEPINDYPNTEESKILASMIRASINILFAGDMYNFNNNWTKQFWNKAYSYEPSRI